MRLQVLSILILITSFYVSCSDHQEGPPTNRRRVNEDNVVEIIDSDTDLDEATDEAFFDANARSLINDDNGSDMSLTPASNTNFLRRNIFIDSSQVPTVRMTPPQQSLPHLNESIIVPTRSQDLNSDAGFIFTQPGQPSHLGQSGQSSLFCSPDQMGTADIPLSQPPRSFVRRFAPHIRSNGNRSVARPPRYDDRIRWYDPIRAPGIVVHFDQSEVEFFNIIRRVKNEAYPPYLRYYGEYTDPNNGSIRYIRLPLMGFPFDETESTSEYDFNEIDDETKDEIIQDETKDEIIQSETPGENATIHVTEQLAGNNDINPSIPAQTPPRGQTSTPIFPDFSSPQVSATNLFTPNSAIIRILYDCSPPAARKPYNYSIRESSCVFPGAFLDPCEVAESIFAQEVSHLNENLQRHTSFPDQEILIELLPEFFKSSRLDDRHLRAFELDFEIFFKLLAKCPRKYFFPSLALSLQYDEDFPKFLSIFFSLKHFFMKGFPDEYQNLFIETVLNMKIISNSAFEFFSSDKNGIFFFSDFSTFPCYYGKFSPHKVAEIVSSYKTLYLDQSEMEYSGNPLRQFLLNFDYFTLIDSFHIYENFSKSNFTSIFRLKNLFKREEDFNISVYKLFKYSNDKTHFYTSFLLSQNAIDIVLKEALKHEDFSIVETLFLKFELESNVGSVQHRKLNRLGGLSLPVSINIKKINKSFCLVKLTVKKGIKQSFSLILPLN